MPPVDPNNTSEPTPAPVSNLVSEPKKEGFFTKIANLFKKKALSPPLAPPTHDSFTPGAQAENQPAESPVATSSAPLAPPPENTDPQTGAPQAAQPSSPDPDGTVTAPSVEVPQSVSSESQGETPTVPVESEPVVPQQPYGASQQPQTQVPIQPVQPAPAVQPPQPVPPSQQPPVPPQQ